MHLGSLKCYLRWLLGLSSQQTILSRLWLGGESWKTLTKFAGATQRRKALMNSKFCQSHQSRESFGNPWTSTLTEFISRLFGVSGWWGGEESCQRRSGAELYLKMGGSNIKSQLKKYKRETLDEWKDLERPVLLTLRNFCFVWKLIFNDFIKVLLLPDAVKHSVVY